MAKNYNKMAIDIVREIGGEENVKSLAHCMTRLRFIVKDEKKVNLEALKKAEGVIQVMVAAGQYQVVIGTDVGDVYDEIGKVTNINLTGEADEDGGTAKKSILTIAIDVISAIFLPFMGSRIVKRISCRLYNSWLVGYSRNNISAFICYGRWRV